MSDPSFHPDRLALVNAPIDLAALERQVARPGAGAVCHFLGVVRDHNLGREVDHLVYEAYPPMALAALSEIDAEIRQRWPEARAAVAHRLGRLEIGEASVAVAVSSPHRAEAFAACRYAIDELKARVPIWKKEVWADGSSWIEGTPPRPLERSAARDDARNDAGNETRADARGEAEADAADAKAPPRA